MTQRELAKHLGISHAQTKREIARGMPVDSLAAAVAWRHANGLPRPQVGSIASETARLRARQADLADIEIRKQKSELLEAEEVSVVTAAGFALVAQELDALPARAAPRIIGLTDVAAIHAILLEEAMSIREHAARELSQYCEQLKNGSAVGS
jgi:hypothetical protein